MSKSSRPRLGFTLIELSIVLVIIGLVIGGVVVGRDLIDAATVRAQISQIEKYQTAVNTFRGKYGYLPGDIPDPTASTFGFDTRGTLPGQGDGNGLLEGFLSYGAANSFGYSGGGEDSAIWKDLATAGLIAGIFPYNDPQNVPYAFVGATAYNNQLSTFLPPAKLGANNYVYVFSAGTWTGLGSTPWQAAGQNYFGIGAVQFTNFAYQIKPGITVQQAYNIDSKIDDGLPQTGSVVAVYPGGPTYGIFPGGYWVTPSGTTAATAGGSGYVPFTTATAGDATTCFDNGGVIGIQHYSTEINSGAGINCALSFKFQ